MAKILITARSFDRQGPAGECLLAAGHEMDYVTQTLTEAELITALGGKAAYIAGLDRISASVINSAQQLKIIARYGVGYDRVDLDAAAKRQMAVTITPGANTIAVAELTLGLMLSVARSIPRLDSSLRSGSWTKHTGPELAGKTLGIIGLGAIGCEVAKRARAFSMNVIAYDTCPREEFCRDWSISRLSLPEVIAQSDFLSLHAPALPETTGIINRHSLGLMKPTAYLINTARGELIVESDLINALQTGVIAGAALDAFTHEPLGDSPLIALPNVVLTPHAGSATKEAAARMSLIAAQEVLRVLTGQKPLYQVN